MKKANILWAALLMTAALVITACSSNDDNILETPDAPPTSKTIPYTVTVNDGATTRATVDGDNKTLRFAAGDKLYITGTNIKGVLNIQTGVGQFFGATFSGDLTYSGEGSPTADLELTATLVSAQQHQHAQVDIDVAGAVTVNYPRTAYCASVNDAVQTYSCLKGTSTYSAKSFTLFQQTAFLNFEITFENGIGTGTALIASVNDNNSYICTAKVTTTNEDGKVIAKFVLPVAAGTSLISPKVYIGEGAISFAARQSLEGKVYNVKKTQGRLLSTATTADYGMVVCAAGHLHPAKTVVSTGCTAVGILGKMTERSHGLILALQTAKDQEWRTINSWEPVNDYASTTLKVLPDDDARGNLTSYTTLGTTAVSDWAVAQKSDYEAIFENLGSKTGDTNGKTYDNNVLGYIPNGGLDADVFWSATPYSNKGYGWKFSSSRWEGGDGKTIRAVWPVLGF